MKVNGNTLREAIHRWEMRREALIRQFNPSFFAKPSAIAAKNATQPETVAKDYIRCEEAIAKLQAIQAKYNVDTTVSFEVEGKQHRMSLSEAVKRIGGAGRLENLWRQASLQAEDQYETQRMMYSDKNMEWPVRTMAIKDIVDRATSASLFTGALRGAIAVGNTREMDFDINPELFK